MHMHMRTPRPCADTHTHTHTHMPLCGYGLSTGPTDGLSSWWLRNRSPPDSQQQQQQQRQLDHDVGLLDYFYLYNVAGKLLQIYIERNACLCCFAGKTRSS